MEFFSNNLADNNRIDRVQREITDQLVNSDSRDAMDGKNFQL